MFKNWFPKFPQDGFTVGDCQCWISDVLGCAAPETIMFLFRIQNVWSICGFADLEMPTGRHMIHRE